MNPAGHPRDRSASDAEDGYAMSKLERRYTRWVTLFYPAHYRRARGTELVDTYLALAAPGRQRPSVADVVDLATGGLQQHLRITEGLRPGFDIAGLLALMTATAFAAGWAILDLVPPAPPWRSPLQPFVTLGAAAWAAWLLAAVVYLAAPGRWFRWATGVAVLVTAGVVPAAMLTGLPRPPLSVLLPQLVLGVVAFGAGSRRPWWARVMPVAAGAASVPLAVDLVNGPDFCGDYYIVAAEVLPSAAGLLLISVMLLALGWAALRDYRGVWALLIMLTPIGMLALSPLGALLDDTGFGQPIIPTWPSMVRATVLVAVGGPALVALSLAIAVRRQPPVTASP